MAFMFSEKSDSAGQIIFCYQYGTLKGVEHCCVMKKSGFNIQFVGRLLIFISNMRPNSTKNGFLDMDVLLEVLICL